MPPQKLRERYNAKARQSSVGSSSHKKRKGKRSRAEQADPTAAAHDGEAGDGVALNDGERDDSNVLLIDPEEQERRKEADRKRRELLAQSGDAEAASAPISSKKRKRLDAYIARQLKKEKRQQLIADLAKTSSQVGDRTALMRASTLGTGKLLSGQEMLDKGVQREENIVNKRRGKSYEVLEQEDSEDEDDEYLGISRSDDEGADPDKEDVPLEMNEEDNKSDDDRQARIAKARALFSSTSAIPEATMQSKAKQPGAPNGQSSAIGSALALGQDGKPMMPVMRKRKLQKRKPSGRRTAWGRVANGPESNSDGESDFDSSASSQDQAELMSESDEDSSDEDGAGDGNIKSIMNDLADPEKADGSDQSMYSTDESASHLTDEDTDGEATDDDGQAILEEAMRLRGMLGDPSRLPPRKEEYEQAEGGDKAGASETSDAEGAEKKASMPFASFDGDDAESEGEPAESSSDDEDDDEDDGEGETSESDENDGEDEPNSLRHGLPQTGRSEGFKEWANSALGLGQGRSADIDDDTYKGPEPVAGYIQRIGDLQDGKIRGPLGQDEKSPAELGAFAQRHYQELQDRSSNDKADTIVVNRSEELQEARLKLPVLADEDKIVRTIMENMVTILCGETGSGKTTQVPQFLFEAGFGSRGSLNPGMIGVTQPRRVAALSMAARVGHELGLGKDRVSHQIRYDATVSANTSVKFMTDGVLLRELSIDFLLQKYSAIVIDEAHERSVNTDVLIGVLSRVAALRAKKWIDGEGKPLRLIIMSATLRVDDFAANKRLFDVPPPILQVEARQYPVVSHFSRRTHHDYLTEAYKKACKIHARLPKGGILIFLTGQGEIATLCHRLEKRFGRRAIEERQRRQRRDKLRHGKEEDAEAETPDKVVVSAKDADVEVEDIDLMTSRQDDAESLIDDEDEDKAFEDAEALETDDDEDADYDADLPSELRDDSDVPMHILPLYSLLPSDRQMRVFEPPPEGSRLVVVATNIAETSLTIPGITYVIDSGRAKDRKYDAVNGVQSFEVGFISKASANQRAGRAGRTGPGHCYRLYSSNLYEEHFAQFAEPEILRMPVDGLVLMMKSMNIDNVANFPFPTSPDRQALVRAERLLVRLGALDADSSVRSASQFKITALGRSMSLFPLGTRLSKLLVQGHQHDCLAYVIALVAAMSVGDPFVREESLHDLLSTDKALEDVPDDEDYGDSNVDEIAKEKKLAKRNAYFKTLNRFAAISGAISDPLRLLSVVGAYEHAGGSLEFCQTNFLMPKMMEEIHKLRAQIASLVQSNAASTTDLSEIRRPKLSPPTPKQLNILRQFLTSAFIDQIAIRADLSAEGAARVPMLQQDGGGDDQMASKNFYRQTKQGAKMQSTRDVAYLAAGVPGEACFIHKSSVLFHRPPPEWLVFTTITRGRAKGDTMERRGRNWLKGITVINPNWVYKLGPSLCTLSKPVEMNQGQTRAKLIEMAKQLKRHADDSTPSSSSASEKDVYLVPTYGTGPAFEASERSSYAGWELPAVTAKQRLVNGKWVTNV